MTSKQKTSRYDLESWLLYSIIVAGKSAEFARNAMTKFLLFAREVETPFEYMKRVGFDTWAAQLRNSRVGNYHKNIKAFQGVLELDPAICTLEQLEDVHGIGPKTSRFFLKVARNDNTHAILDVHILRWLNHIGHKAPKNTPTGEKYLALEKVFLEEAQKRGIDPADLDTKIWLYCSSGKYKGAWQWPEALRRGYQVSHHE